MAPDKHTEAKISRHQRQLAYGRILLLMGAMTTPITLAGSASEDTAVPLNYWVMMTLLLMVLFFLYSLWRDKRKHLVKDRALFLKVKENEDLRSELVKHKTIDPLTGLGNRRYLYASMDQEIARICREYADWIAGRSFAPENSDVIYMLLMPDQYQKIRNQNCPTGELLIQIKDVMRQVMRDTDLLIRWEDHIFLAVFRQANRSSGPHLAERLRQAVAQHPFHLQGVTTELSCTISFCCFPFVRKNPALVHWKDVMAIAQAVLRLTRSKGSNSWMGIYSTKTCRQDPGLSNTIIQDCESMIHLGELKAYQSSNEAEQ